jgi:hypothetical protein
MSGSNHLKWSPILDFSQCDSHRRFERILALCIAFFALLPHLSHASEWHSVNNTSDGIQIFRKEVNDSGLIAFRGIGVVNAPLPLVATVILDTDRRREWITGLVDSRIIRWEDEYHFIEYDHIGMPLIIKDRDFVSNIEISFDLTGKILVFHYQPSNDPSAPRTNFIRGELIDVTFILRSIDNDKKTWVDAVFLCNPKGWIPKWVVNFFLNGWPKTTFRALRKEVLKNISVDTRFSTLLKSGITGR